MKIRFTTIQTLAKPRGAYIAKQQLNTADVEVESLIELKNKIETGYAFYSAVYNDTIQRNSSFEYFDMLVLDIDDTLQSLAWTIDILKRNNIMPNVYYSTFSGKLDPKNSYRYRLVYRIHRTNSLKVYTLLSYLISKILNIKLDTQALVNSRTQIYQATDKPCYYINDEINIDIFKLLAIVLSTTTQTKRMLERIATDTNITLLEKHFAIAVDNEILSEDYQTIDDNTYINYDFKNIKIKRQNGMFTIPTTVDKNTKMETLLNRCPFANDINAGKTTVKNEIRWRLALQLTKISGGADWFMQMLKNQGMPASEAESLMNYYTTKSIENTLPACVDGPNGCPYFNNCKYKNMYYIATKGQNAVSSQIKDDTYTADKMYNDMLEDLKDIVFESNPDIVDVFEVPVSAGKSTAYKFLLSPQNVDTDLWTALVALPNHQLATEVYNDLVNQQLTKQAEKDYAQKSFVYAYARPTLIDSKTEELVSYYESEGAYKEVKDTIRKYMKDNDFKYLKLDDKTLLNEFNTIVKYDDENMLKAFISQQINHKEYSKLTSYVYSVDFRLHKNVLQLLDWLKSIEDSKEADYAITTHAALMCRKLNNYKQKLILIDEDDFSACLQSKKYSYKKIYTISESIFKELKGPKDENNLILNKLLDIFDAVKNNKIAYINFKLSKKEIEIIKQLRKKYNFNFLNFLTSNSFNLSEDGKYIYATKIYDINARDNQKIIYFTATPQPLDFFKHRFPDREIRIHTYKNVSIKGTFVDEKKFGKVYYKSLTEEKIIDICNYLKAEKITEAIVPKKYKDSFNQQGIDTTLHHGNAVGINSLSGKQLAVISQQIPSAVDVFKIVSLIERRNIDEKELTNIVYRKQELFGKRQMCMSYNNELADSFLKWVAEADIVQAIGRARLLRYEDAKVIYIGAFDVEV